MNDFSVISYFFKDKIVFESHCIKLDHRVLWKN